MCQIRLANLICMWLMFLGILVTGITMCIPRETLIDLFNDDGVEEETQRCNSNGRDGYQSIKQNDFDGKIQIIKQDEPNVSLIGGGINGNGNGPSKQPNKLKGEENDDFKSSLLMDVDFTQDQNEELDNIISKIGMGRFQKRLLVVCGFGWFSDSVCDLYYL